MRKLKQIMIAICCLHGLVTSAHLLNLYSHTWYGYMSADGTPKRVIPAEQAIGMVLGATVFALSCALFVRNRWLTSLLIVATFGMFIHATRADGGGVGVFDDSGVFAAMGLVLTFIWYVPQIAMLLLVLALTWRDPSRHRELVGSLRMTSPGLRSVATESPRRSDKGNQLSSSSEDSSGNKPEAGDGIA